jgi:large subunit ribosomal protein L20
MPTQFAADTLNSSVQTNHTGNKPVARSASLRFSATCAFPLHEGDKPMPRVKRGTKRRARRKKYLKRTKGFFLTKSKLYQSAQEAANRADRYAKRDRRIKKRQYRRLWIQRVGAAARQNGLTYGQLIHGLKSAGILIDRKVLADLAVRDEAGFAQLAEKAKAFAPKPAAPKAPAAA